MRTEVKIGIIVCFVVAILVVGYLLLPFGAAEKGGGELTVKPSDVKTGPALSEISRKSAPPLSLPVTANQRSPQLSVSAFVPRYG
ncbi:MAG: hypothetical protein HQ546_01960, partial [Planctomycetes bacterium]|nr:hypothetical protein [Planctomycetota bacterium]